MTEYVVGADIGLKRDHTAIVVCERYYQPSPMEGEEPLDSYRVVYTQQLPLGNEYTSVKTRLDRVIGEVYRRQSLLQKAIRHLSGGRPYVEVNVDATGVGLAISSDLIEVHGRPINQITFTSGNTYAPHGDGTVTVGKAYMSERLHRLLATSRLTIPKGAPGDGLRRELAIYSKTQRAGSIIARYAAAGTGHDDYVSALGLATLEPDAVGHGRVDDDAADSLFNETGLGWPRPDVQDGGSW